MLSDAVKGDDKKGKDVAIEVEIAAPTTLEAASKMIVAFKHSDAAALDDALHMWQAACDASYEKDDDEAAGSLPALPKMKSVKESE